jgi:dTDP-glucose pyrophosphorylase/CBS domain-containing protein
MNRLTPLYQISGHFKRLSMSVLSMDEYYKAMKFTKKRERKKYMANLEKITVSPNTSIHETLKIIDSQSYHIALVINDQHELVGTVTDGDIRRGILKGIALDEPVKLVMNNNPITIDENASSQEQESMMRKHLIHHLPIVNIKKQLVDLAIRGKIAPKLRNNWVVIMAGGLGTRLYPLTKDCPKPLLKVGDKPLLETIILNLKGHGFHKFYLSVNYKSEMIEKYFQDGSQWGITIRYLKENQRLGTAGALSLIPEIPEESIVVINGDVLTKMDATKLLDYHLKNKAAATMCVREYEIQVPYGVCNIMKNQLHSIEEKPVYRYFISAGINVLSPPTLEKIPKDSFYDMPMLFKQLLLEKEGVFIFPIREYWLDIGQMADYERANIEFFEVFGHD